MADSVLPPRELETQLAALHLASFGWACSCCDGNADDAADVLQSSYVKVLAGSARFEGRSTFRTWLFGVIRLTALESRRRSLREHVLSAQQQPPISPAEADAALLEHEESEQLQRALGELPPRQREILHLVFYQGLSVAESATVMELSVGSARVHYDRGKKRLRVLLSPVFRDDVADDMTDHGVRDA